MILADMNKKQQLKIVFSINSDIGSGNLYIISRQYLLSLLHQGLIDQRKKVPRYSEGIETLL
jgi:hypothetical protein